MPSPAMSFAIEFIWPSSAWSYICGSTGRSLTLWEFLWCNPVAISVLFYPLWALIMGDSSKCERDSLNYPAPAKFGASYPLGNLTSVLQFWASYISCCSVLAPDWFSLICSSSALSISSLISSLALLMAYSFVSSSKFMPVLVCYIRFNSTELLYC